MSMSLTAQPVAVLLMAMGGPDCLENVEPYLQDVRGGRPTSPELVEEIRERYRMTGGKSPVLDITREVARALEQRLNRSGDARYRCYVGLRHWHPFIKEAYAELLEALPDRIIGLCMAPQYSSLSIGAYMKKVEEARAELASETPISFVTSWHRHPLLVAAIVEKHSPDVGEISRRGAWASAGPVHRPQFAGARGGHEGSVSRGSTRNRPGGL
jgi:ferrochelatase